MKKITSIFLITLFTLFISFNSAYATSSDVNISSNVKSISTEEEFIVTLSISNDKILNGIQFSLDFNKEAFDLQKVELEDPENYALFGATSESIDILSLKGNNVPLVVNITLKVKDSTKTDNYTISASNLKVSFIEDDEIESFEPIDLKVQVNGLTNFNILLWLAIGLVLVLTAGRIFIRIRRLKNQKKKDNMKQQ